MINLSQKDYYRSVGRELHESLAAQINVDKFVGWEEFGMVELTDQYPKGKKNHPLEAGHERIANEIYSRC
jgi:hypothetical protein